MTVRSIVAVFALCGLTLPAQGPPGRGPGSELIREGSQLDLEGKGAEARATFQKGDRHSAERPGEGKC
ncbi:MAG: hypothetical protein JOZ62_05265 [Acidobacteriaceae bacterium]|nr:hypothetical protein [Acidobacteriaceae bacterium]